MNIEIPISAGELLDKLSILQIKKEKVQDSIKLKNINHEYKLLSNLSLHLKEKDEKSFNSLYNEVLEVNKKLWIIEDDKRLCEKNSDFGEKFIKLSRDVHFLNDNRAKIKLEINNHTGSKIKEIKEYTKY